MCKLEICCASAADAVNAANGGADRIELNSAIAYGGLTPNLAELEAVKNKIDIPIMVMIRPRSGGFCYSEIEFEVMKREIELAGQFGADGFVFGILNNRGEVDIDRNKILKDIAGDKVSVFHRAFDVTPDPFLAIDQIKKIGFDRILTSAQANKVADNLKVARAIISYAKNKLEIVLAGGIRDYNLLAILKNTGVSQVHLSAFSDEDDNSMLNKKITFNKSCIPESKYQLIDSEKVEQVKNILTEYEFDSLKRGE